MFKTYEQIERYFQHARGRVDLMYNAAQNTVMGRDAAPKPIQQRIMRFTGKDTLSAAMQELFEIKKTLADQERMARVELMMRS